LPFARRCIRWRAGYLAGKTYVTPLVTKGMPLGVFLRRATKPATEKLTARQREVLQLSRKVAR